MKRLLALLLLSAGAAAQVRESVTVEVIEVPVYVTTAAGEPVRGLPREAFELFVDRKPRAVEYFDVIDFASPAGGVHGPRDRRQRRLYLLLFDLCFAKPGKLARAQRAALSLLEHAAPTDFFAVASYTSTRGVQFASAFLNDQVALRRAIQTLAVGELHDPLGVGVSASERSAWIDPGGAAASSSMEVEPVEMGGDAGGRAASNASMAAREMQDAMRGGFANQTQKDEPMRRLIRHQVDEFADAAARLNALEGQKHVVLFSEGFSAAYILDVRGGMIATSRAGAGDHTVNLLQSMNHVFARAGVFLHTVDISGQRLRRDNFEESLQILAHGTGGEFVRDQNDLAAGIRSLVARQEVVYLLGFTRRSDRAGTVDVRVKGLPRGARVSFRPGFGKPPERGEVDPLQLADVLLNDIPQSGLRVATRFTPAAGGGELEFALSPREIAPQLQEKTPYVDAVLYVFDAAGATILARSKHIVFDDKLRHSDAPLILREHLAAPPGAYAAKAVVRIAGTQSLGFARADFKVE